MVRVLRSKYPFSRRMVCGSAACALLIGFTGTLAISRPIDLPAPIATVAPAPPASAAPRITVTPVDRSAKGDRLTLKGREGASQLADIRSDAQTTVATKGTDMSRRAPSTGNVMPRGCLSSIGGVTSGRSSEMFAICVADSSMIQD